MQIQLVTCSKLACSADKAREAVGSIHRKVHVPKLTVVGDVDEQLI